MNRGHVKRYCYYIISAFFFLGIIAGCENVYAGNDLPEYVYVAGNPDSYPVEYYDDTTGQFEGLIPELYQQLEEKTGIEFRYFNVDEEDHRYEDAMNRQVEIITCFQGEDTDFAGLNLLYSKSICEFKKNGTSCQLQFGYTPIVSEELQEAIDKGLAEIGSDELLSITITQVNDKEQIWRNRFTGIFNCLISLIILVVIFLLVAFLVLRRKKKKKELQQYIDPLTGIGNKQYFVQYFKEKINEENRYTHCAVSVSFDANELMRYMPQKIYERFVISISDHIDSLIHEDDFYAYVDTGRFEVIMEMNNIDDVIRWVETFTNKFSQYMKRYTMGELARLFFGIYILSTEDTEVYDILRKTAYAAEVAREKDYLYGVYTPEMERNFRQETMVRTMAKQIMQNDEIILFYQPFLSGDGAIIKGAEACSRWKHSREGYLRPDQFIHILEQSDDIADFDLYVMDKVCLWLNQQKLEKNHPFIVTVNVSRKSLSVQSFASLMLSILRKHHITTDRIALEISEGSRFSQLDMKDNIDMLHEAGIRIIIDGFGGNGTSLQDIIELHPDAVKLDYCITKQLKTQDGRQQFTKLIAFLQGVGVEIAIQGVEEQEQIDFLKTQSCDYLQGYYYYPPLPEKEIYDIMNN